MWRPFSLRVSFSLNLFLANFSYAAFLLNYFFLNFDYLLGLRFLLFNGVRIIFVSKILNLFDVACLLSVFLICTTISSSLNLNFSFWVWFFVFFFRFRFLFFISLPALFFLSFFFSSTTVMSLNAIPNSQGVRAYKVKVPVKF